MALFLKMKSINESEIQESTSPCASHVHIQHLETHNIYFWQTSTGILTSEKTFQQWLINTLMDGHAYSETGNSKNISNGQCTNI